MGGDIGRDKSLGKEAREAHLVRYGLLVIVLEVLAGFFAPAFHIAPATCCFRKVVEQDGFYQNIEASYAASWALFYYLYKRKPRQLFEYLKILAEKYPCALYPKEDRIKDFESVFGDDWEKLARDVDKFVRKS